MDSPKNQGPLPSALSSFCQDPASNWGNWEERGFVFFNTKISLFCPNSLANFFFYPIDHTIKN